MQQITVPQTQEAAGDSRTLYFQHFSLDVRLLMAAYGCRKLLPVLPQCFPKWTENHEAQAYPTHRQHSNFAEGKDEDFAWDTELENFGLRLRRSAEGVRRTYVVQYRVHGRTRREKLGDRLTLVQARAAARRTLVRVSNSVTI